MRQSRSLSPTKWHHLFKELNAPNCHFNATVLRKLEIMLVQEQETESSLTSLAMSVYFCFSLGSSTAHQSARILVAPRLSRRGCSCRTRERWRLQKRRKAFIGRRARCSFESSSTSSVVLPHCTCEPCSCPHSTGCW